jgi:hypothetical protein
VSQTSSASPPEARARIGRPELQRLVLEALADEGASLPQDPHEQAETPLIGEGAALKSVGLVAMLVSVEQRLAEEFGVQVSLMDDHAMSQARSPFRTVTTLVDYLLSRLGEGTASG